MIIEESNFEIPYAYRNPMMRNNPVNGQRIPPCVKLSTTARNWTPYEKYAPFWWNSHYGSVVK